MRRKLPPGELELYQRCDEVLHYVWDPIGAAGGSRAVDEYHAYLPRVFSLVKEHEASELVAYLLKVEADAMGLPPRPEMARRAAEVLMECRREIEGRVAS